MKRYALYVTLIFIVSLITSCGGDSGSAGGDNGAVPAMPQWIKATEGVFKDKVEVYWDDSVGSHNFVLYKSIDDKNNFRVIATDITGNSFVDDRVTPNRIYYYKVAAANGDKWSQPSIDACGFAHDGKPLAPVNVVASKSKIGEILIEWKEVPQCDYYRVFRSDNKNGGFSEIVSNITSTNYTDTSVPVRDKKYFYCIQAISNNDGEGDLSDVADGIALEDIPLPPVTVNATDGIYGNKVDITWAAADKASMYALYRAVDNDGVAETDDSSEYELVAANITELLYEDTTVIVNQLYRYKVAAISSGGEGEKSNSCAGKSKSGAPIQTPAPQNLRATDGDYDIITITWDAVTSATAYSLYRSDSLNGQYTLIANRITESSFVDTPPSLVTKYYYKVTSWSEGSDPVESYYSLYDDGYAMPQIPDSPSGFTSSKNRTDGKIILSWSTAARADFYRLYRSESKNGIYNLLASGISNLTYSDDFPSIVVGKDYYYKISAVNVSGESNMTDYILGNTKLAVPGNFTVSYSNKQVLLRWSPVIGATSYRVQRRKFFETSYKDIGTTDQCNFIDTGLSWGQHHYYKVQAINSSASGDFTESQSVYVIW
jgi:fibronectin type 3 domain-containing protein